MYVYTHVSDSNCVWMYNVSMHVKGQVCKEGKRDPFIVE